MALLEGLKVGCRDGLLAGDGIGSGVGSGPGSEPEMWSGLVDMTVGDGDRDRSRALGW